MKISEDTQILLTQLEEYAKGKLNFTNECGLLIELSARFKKEQELAAASFSAKGLLAIFSIMKKNGPGTQGYEALVKEFQTQLHHATTNIKALLEYAPADVIEKFSAQFFAQTQEAFAEFLSLCSDLRVLKNWNIDKEGSVKN